MYVIMYKELKLYDSVIWIFGPYCSYEEAETVLDKLSFIFYEYKYIKKLSSLDEFINSLNNEKST